MISAARLVANASGVLLDFDGPITPLMPPPANKEAAEDARAAMRDAGAEVPPELADSTDHLAILRAAADFGPEVLRAVEDACMAAEIECAKTATSTPGAHEFLWRCYDDDQRVVIVSNNAAEAVCAYLDRWDLNDLVTAVLGRSRYRPDLMKPHPFVVDAALEVLNLNPANTVLIGDAVTDMQVARSVGTRAIGYAKRAGRASDLAEAGADAVVLSMTELIRNQ